MRLLRLAIETQRWDLAAHTLVLASASVLGSGDRGNANTKEKKQGHTGQRRGGTKARVLRQGTG